MAKETGLSRAVCTPWGSHVIRGPDVFALPLTTYYVYTIDDCPPQALMRRCFGAREYEDRGKIVAWRLISISNPGDSELALWRREDWELMMSTIRYAWVSRDDCDQKNGMFLHRNEKLRPPVIREMSGQTPLGTFNRLEFWNAVPPGH